MTDDKDSPLESIRRVGVYVSLFAMAMFFIFLFTRCDTSAFNESKNEAETSPTITYWTETDGFGRTIKCYRKGFSKVCKDLP